MGKKSLKSGQEPEKLIEAGSSQEAEEMPTVIMVLAATVDGVPLSWAMAPDHVTIVMQDGRKVRFARESHA